jgi:hypothetical protein
LIHQISHQKCIISRGIPDDHINEIVVVIVSAAVAALARTDNGIYEQQKKQCPESEAFCPRKLQRYEIFHRFSSPMNELSRI